MPTIQETLMAMHVPRAIAERVRGNLGHGVEGVVYDLGGGKVLKVNRKASRSQSVRKIARRVKGRGWAAQIYESGRLKSPEGRDLGFWYVSDRLFPLPGQLQAVLNAMGFAIMAHAKGQMDKAASDRRIAQAIVLMPGALRATVRRARAAGYHDLHGGNVMVTATGRYKVVDLESLRPLPRRPKGAG